MAKRMFSIRVDEQFFEDLRAIQASQEFAPAQTEIVTRLVSKEAERLRKAKKRKAKD